MWQNTLLFFKLPFDYNFDESAIETKTEIENPTGQLEFLSKGYIGG